MCPKCCKAGEVGGKGISTDSYGSILGSCRLERYFEGRKILNRKELCFKSGVRDPRDEVSREVVLLMVVGTYREAMQLGS